MKRAIIKFSGPTEALNCHANNMDYVENCESVLVAVKVLANYYTSNDMKLIESIVLEEEDNTPCMSDLDEFGDIIPYSAEEEAARVVKRSVQTLETALETLEAKYNASTGRNAYKIGVSIRAIKAEIEALTK